MNTPRHAFRLKLGFFLPQSVGYFHDFPFEYELVVFTDQFSLRNFEGIVTVNRTPQGLLLQRMQGMLCAVVRSSWPA